MRTLPDPELYDLNAILIAVRKHLEGDALTEDARNRARVVAEAIERHLAAAGERKVEVSQNG
jgi:hypothetical protein